MRDDVVALLHGLGLEVDGGDPLLGFILRRVQERIQNDTNQPEIPDGLYHMAVEMAVGYYLESMRDGGKLDEGDPTTGITAGERVIQSIQEGDTKITYAVDTAGATPGQRLDGFIDHLMNGRRGELLRYRRLVW